MTGAVWSPTALRDVQRQFTYLRALDFGAAIRTVEAIIAKGEYLARFPATGSPFKHGQRKSLVQGTRYLIVYRSLAEGVEIARVHHESQNWRPH